MLKRLMLSVVACSFVLSLMASAEAGGKNCCKPAKVPAIKCPKIKMPKLKCHKPKPTCCKPSCCEPTCQPSCDSCSSCAEHRAHAALVETHAVPADAPVEDAEFQPRSKHTRLLQLLPMHLQPKPPQYQHHQPPTLQQPSNPVISAHNTDPSPKSRCSFALDLSTSSSIVSMTTHPQSPTDSPRPGFVYFRPNLCWYVSV